MFPLAAPALVDIFDITFLNMSGIEQHDRSQIAGSVGTPDWPLKAPPDQGGNITNMIDVGVGDDKRIDLRGFKG